MRTQMTEIDVSAHRHDHRFTSDTRHAERNTRRVVVIALVMMVIEVVGGYALNSMALLADGWHMSSHALAMGLSLGAYVLARRYANDHRFAFGTWKIEILGAFSSALLLGVVAVLMLWQSVERMFSPSPIHYDEAIAIALLGLAVNLLCAWLLRDTPHEHGHGHGHGQHQDHPHADGQHPHGHGHHDVNLRAAYIHVIADAATSLLAIGALLGGRFFGASWLDPVMGIIGAMLVTRWAIGLLRESGAVLLDAEMHHPVVDEIRGVVRERLPRTAISDLHVWRVGRGSYACVLALVSREQVSPARVREYLSVHEELVHVTVEVVTPAGA